MTLIDVLLSKYSTVKKELEVNDERDGDVMVVNTKYVTQTEKDIIYTLYKFIQDCPQFTDADLQYMVKENPTKMCRFETLVTNFPNLIDCLWAYGYEGTLKLCANDRCKKATLIGYQKRAEQYILSRKKHASRDSVMFKYLVHLRALEMYMERNKLTDGELQEMIEHYPEELSLYKEMYDITDIVYDIRYHNYKYPAIKIARVLSNKELDISEE